MSNNTQLVHQLLEAQASEWGDSEVLVHEKRRMTYSELDSQSGRIAQWLVEKGVGDRVVLMSENSIEYVISYYGILKSGGVVVSLSTGLKPEGIEPLLGELEPVCAIVSQRHMSKSGQCNTGTTKSLLCLGDPSSSSALPLETVAIGEVLTADRKKTGQPSVSVTPDDLAAIIYTSGSTGTPKGVMLTHASIVANTRSICEYLRLTKDDVQMVVLPFFYVMGKSLLNTHIAVGGRVVTNKKFALPAAVLNQMVAEGVTGFSGVPSTFAYLLHRSPLQSMRDQLSSLRYVSQAGGHMDRKTKLGLRDVLPEATEIVVMYGATEASARLTWLDPKRFEDKIESIGKAIPGVTVRIIREDGTEALAGETGEIVAQGANVMRGYWKDEATSQRVLDANGYHTGDLGYVDDEGFIFVAGRKDNQLKVGGHRINVQEIEDALMETGRLVEVVVLGMADAILGTKLEALGVPMSSEETSAGIIADCAEVLPRYKLPQSVTFIRSLPKKPNGKIDRSLCKAELEKAASQSTSA
jgi:acyl-CoA synthetase (AMP-forming)/AMP-acid ligase II